MAAINAPSKEYIGDALLRVEGLRERKAELADAEKAIFAEAKALGYTPKYLRYLLKLRALSPNEVAETDAMVAIYREAAGLGELPLFKALSSLSADTASQDSIIEALKPVVPDTGHIIVQIAGEPIKLSRDANGDVIQEVHREPKPDFKPDASKGQDGRAALVPVPDVNEAGAAQLGAQAYRDDVAIVKNPFPAGDARRRAWDKGWRDASGGDGMGPQGAGDKP